MNNLMTLKKDMHRLKIKLHSIKNKLLKTRREKTVYEPIMEITTRIGCQMMCTYCPQNKLIKAYSAKSSIFLMSFDNFKICLDKIPATTQIHFSGMAEPWLNPECTKMLIYAHEKGHKIIVYTTLIGMQPKDVELIKNIPFKIFKVHLPDTESHSRIQIDETYLKTLKKLTESNIQNISYMTMGTLCPQVKEMVNIQAVKPSFNSRAGNIGAEKDTEPTKIKTGKIRCEASGNMLDHNVLLPNGDVLLCCMDYGMKHTLGNLLSDNYASLFNGDEFSKIKNGLLNDSIDILCRKCIMAKEY